MEQKFNLKDVKVLRTKEGTIFEVVTIGVLIASIAMGTAWHHFMIRDLFIMPLLILVPLFVAYKPSHINMMGMRLKNIKQVSLAVRMSRIIALVLALLCLSIAVVGHDHSMTKTLSFGIVIVLGLVGLLFVYLIKKAD